MRDSLNDIFYPPTKPTTTRIKFARYAYGRKIERHCPQTLRTRATRGFFYACGFGRT